MTGITYFIVLWYAVCPSLSWGPLGIKDTPSNAPLEMKYEQKYYHEEDWSKASNLTECQYNHLAIFAHPKKVTRYDTKYEPACCDNNGLCMCFESKVTSTVVFEN